MTTRPVYVTTMVDDWERILTSVQGEARDEALQMLADIKEQVEHSRRHYQVAVTCPKCFETIKLD